MLVRQKTYEENNAKLYMVGVPIGNYDDMSYRAVETLKNVDILLLLSYNGRRIIKQENGGCLYERKCY